jgi:hypothetical protein
MTKPAAADSHPQAASLDLFQASLCFLMNRYLHLQNPCIAAAVVDHLRQLSAHPDLVFYPVQRQVYARLLQEWRLRLPQRGGAALH